MTFAGYYIIEGAKKNTEETRRRHIFYYTKGGEVAKGCEVSKGGEVAKVANRGRRLNGFKGNGVQANALGPLNIAKLL